jgi:Zn-dependent M28 family amino/carboxypeptidase
MLFRKFKISDSLKNFPVVYLFFLVVYFAEAQEVNSLDTVIGSITENDLIRHLEIIANDSLEGRETGQPGLQKAAEYLQDQLAEIGLNPVKEGSENPYFQSFELIRGKGGDVSLQAGDFAFKDREDIIYIGNTPESYKKNIRLKFAGYGREEDYVKMDLENKGIVVLLPEHSNNWEDMLTTAKANGIDKVFIVYGDSDEAMKKIVPFYNNYRRGIRFKPEDTPSNEETEVFLITPGTAENIFDTSMKKLRSALKKTEKGKYNSINKIPEVEAIAEVERTEEVIHTQNVIGIVEGLRNPEEVILLTAHYDHVGIINGEIYNGADDNGSGTAAILELAQAFAIARDLGIGPKRSVMFALLTGEEKGLLGSSYYVEEPIFPLDKTIANFNIDMIGRIDNKYIDNPDYVYLIGSDKISQELHTISENANKNHLQLILDYTYNADDHPERFYYRSDQYNFAKNGIPVIFYFTGVHNDYHKPTDVVDKILFDRMVSITKLIFYTAWEVANMDRDLR